MKAQKLSKIIHNKDDPREVLVKKVSNEQGEVKKEIFSKTDERGENMNPSEQQLYPGTQKHDSNVDPDSKKPK